MLAPSPGASASPNDDTTGVSATPMSRSALSATRTACLPATQPGPYVKLVLVDPTNIAYTAAQLTTEERDAYHIAAAQAVALVVGCRLRGLPQTSYI
jgi:hypothetical protein